MPLPKAKRSASKKRKEEVMDEAMHELKQAHPGWSRAKKVAVGLKTSGQSKKRHRKGRKA